MKARRERSGQQPEQGTRPEAPEPAVLALQRTAGNATVTRLLQRRVLLGAPGAERELTPEARRAFVAGRSFGGRGPGVAARVLEDMASSGDDLHFADRAELEQELIQRVSASALMTESQHEHRRAFGYPYRGQAALYGPRVNFAAREFWDAHADYTGGGDKLVVDYADRSHDDAARRAVRAARDDGARATALHDLPPTYSFVLNVRGRANPAAALRALFTPQPPHLRTLIHFDYRILTLGAGEWQLENAILIDRRHGEDIFLGHGSGEATERQMHERLVARYNCHVREAQRMVRAAEHGAGAARERAQRWLQHHFVTRDGAGHWSISSPIAAWPVVVELRELTADEVPGLHAPFEFIAGRRDQLNEVRRPVASRDYPAETTR